MTSTILIVHSDNWPGVARLPAVLAKAGAVITAMAPIESYLHATRYVSDSIVVPSAHGAIVDELRAHLQNKTYGHVIIADDPLLNTLAERSVEESWIREILPVPNAQSISMLTSKLAFLARCRENALPIAESASASNVNEAGRIAERLSYPVMLKLSTGHGGNGVKRVDTADEMQGAFEPFAQGREITIERYVAGKIGGCEVLFDHGRPVCWSAFVTYRSDTEYSASTARKMFAHPKLAGIVERVGSITQFNGFGVLDFIYDDVNDELVLLELNFRPGPGTHIRGPIRDMFAAGFASMLRSEAPSGPRTHGLEGKVVAFFPQDVHGAISAKDPWPVLQSILLGRSHTDIPFDDIPLLARHLQGIAGRFRRPFRKAARGGKDALNRIIEQFVTGYRRQQ